MSVCRECGFPLCLISTPGDIIYIGDLDVHCGNCGCTFIAKSSLCTATSPFATENEVEMARFLQELSRQSNADCVRLTPLMVRERMVKRFGASNYFKYKKSIMRDLALITHSSKSTPRGSNGRRFGKPLRCLWSCWSMKVAALSLCHG